MYAFHLQLFAKPVVDFLFVLESAFLEKIGHFECKFHVKGASPAKQYWCQKSTTYLVKLKTAQKSPSGIKIYEIDYFVLSQSTCVTDGQTDRITTAIPRQHALHAARGKSRPRNTRVINENNVTTFFMDHRVHTPCPHRNVNTPHAVTELPYVHSHKQITN